MLQVDEVSSERATLRVFLPFLLIGYSFFSSLRLTIFQIWIHCNSYRVSAIKIFLALISLFELLIKTLERISV